MSARQKCGCRNRQRCRRKSPILILFTLRAAQRFDSNRSDGCVRSRFNDYFEHSFNMNQILA